MTITDGMSIESRHLRFFYAKKYTLVIQLLNWKNDLLSFIKSLSHLIKQNFTFRKTHFWHFWRDWTWIFYLQAYYREQSGETKCLISGPIPILYPNHEFLSSNDKIASFINKKGVSSA